MSQPDRRHVLKGLTGLTVAALVPVALVPMGCGPGAEDFERLALRQTAEVTSLGRKYLEQSGKVSRQQLARQLLDGLEGRYSDPLAERLEQSMRRDFAEGDIVVLDGWHLARTEVRLFALAAVLENPLSHPPAD